MTVSKTTDMKPSPTKTFSCCNLNQRGGAIYVVVKMKLSLLKYPISLGIYNALKALEDMIFILAGRKCHHGRQKSTNHHVCMY